MLNLQALSEQLFKFWGRPSTGNELLVTCQLTVQPPHEGRQIQMELHFFQVEIFQFLLYFATLSVPNVSQTCKLIKNTLIRPKGPYKLLFKN